MEGATRVRGHMIRPDGTLGPWAFAHRNGRIIATGPDARGERTIDHRTHIVVAGGIDPHVHFRDPGAPQKEDFESGTRAAALGGITTVLDMPNTSPPTITAEALAQKRAIAETKACIDFGLHIGLDEAGSSIALLPQATSMKIYLGATTGHLLVRDQQLVRRALTAAAATGRTVAFHAESQGCLDRHANLANDAFPSHAHSRPAICEAESIRDIELAARSTNARIHIAHLSTGIGLEAIAGTGFTAEVTPHHLLFTQDRLNDGGHYKMNPPLRTNADLAALWDGLLDGRIACLASDHAPHTPQEKAAPRNPDCPAGVPGVQTLIPIILPHVKNDRTRLTRILQATTAAARIYHLPKGSLQTGYDADYAVYDLTQERPIRTTDMASRAGWTPFENQPAIYPTHVHLHGQPIVTDGTFVGQPGTGRYVVPT